MSNGMEYIVTLLNFFGLEHKCFTKLQGFGLEYQLFQLAKNGCIMWLPAIPVSFSFWQWIS